MTWLPAIASLATLIVAVAVMLRVLLVLERIEDAAVVVATNLAVAQIAVEGVASDLLDSHDRANAVVGEPGAAADEAARKPNGA